MFAGGGVHAALETLAVAGSARLAGPGAAEAGAGSARLAGPGVAEAGAGSPGLAGPVVGDIAGPSFGDLAGAGLLELAHGNGTGFGGSAEAGWTSFLVIFGAFLLVVAWLVVSGRAPERTPRPLVPLLRAAGALERLTGVPGWAATTVGTALFGIFIAGVGFYRDVGYHIAYGRDDFLFTSPHTEIFVGLVLILAAPILGIGVASVTRPDVGLRRGRLVVPWSTIPLLALGLGAVAGFPIDEIWHQAFGVDVTMWSPPHLMMILGATFAGAATWLVLGEAGVRPDAGWGRGLHYATAVFTLLGLNAPLAEFAFGVPQWQQLYHPVVAMLAAGVALVATRLVLGRWSALIVAAGVFSIGGLRMLDLLPGVPIDLRQASAYVGSAAAVEIAARIVGTESPLRFALASATGIATLGLAVEWAWNSRAYQPWTSALLPDAVLVGALAAAAAALLGVVLGTTATRRDHGLSPVVLGIAGAAAFVALAIPFPRTVGDVTAEVSVEHIWADEQSEGTEEDTSESADGEEAAEDPRGNHVIVTARFDPPDAVENARWLQVLAWQGGDRVIAPMEHRGDGVYVATRPVPVTGFNKVMLRMQRGSELVAVPIRFPEDPEIGAPEIPAEDRTEAFADEAEYLQREVAMHDAGPGWLRWLISAVFALIVAMWAAGFAFGFGRVRRDEVTQPVSR